jgi:hypothetical protein
LSVGLNNGTAVPVQVKLNGPGDVTGFDKSQVVRTEPRAWTADFEPNYFPAIEFDRPDLPWLFSPASANANDRLRPWICLIVVRQQEGVRIRLLPGSALPVLEIKPPAEYGNELPNLAESWAWAHAQVTGILDEEHKLTDLQRDSPELTLSRLLCPRKLTPKTRYYGCVVPTFELGCKAALGQEITADDETHLKPSWDLNDPDQTQIVRLPVYYQWEFQTSEGGDFESLVRLLRARSAPSQVGYHDMNVGKAGFGLPEIALGDPGSILAMEGALRAPQNEPKPWPDPPREEFQNTLREILNTPETQVANPANDPILAPPIYARWHAAKKTVPMKDDQPHWLRELNLDPRHRAAAGLGTLVVHDQQEQLMASAWKQIGDVISANRALKEAQMARAAGLCFLARHLEPMSGAQLIATTAPVHARVLMSPITLRYMLAESSLQPSAVSGVFRRIVRIRSPIRRRFPLRPDRVGRPLIERLNDRSIQPLPARHKPDGTITLDEVTATHFGRNLPEGIIPKSGILTPEVVTSAPGNTFYLPGGEGEPIEVGPKTPNAIKFLEAVVNHLAATVSLLELEGPTKGEPLSLPQAHATLLSGLDPRITIPARVKQRVKMNILAWTPDDPIEPIMAHPVFPQPMYEPLRDLSQDYLVPGVELIPPNTVTLLETNSRFIEAYMVGLNHEMARELLWREYPTDQRGSYFRQFWDVSGHIPEPANEDDVEELKDIPAIHTWKKVKSIGQNSQGPGAKSSLVFVIRGELLRRYPNTVIYAAEAEESQDSGHLQPGDNEKYPVFRGTLSPDITFIGFELTEEEALGDDDQNLGWFFILQEQPTEPRFGLDVATNYGGKVNDWSNLSWGQMASDAEEFAALTHAPAVANPGASGLEPKWGANSAAMAHINLQQPMRVAIHAKSMIKKAED